MSTPARLKLSVSITGESIEDLLIALEEVWGSIEGNYVSGYGGTEGSTFKFEIIKDSE